jgi:hypothetical protein
MAGASGERAEQHKTAFRRSNRFSRRATALRLNFRFQP